MPTIDDLREQLEMTVKLRQTMMKPRDVRFIGSEDLVLKMGAEYPRYEGPQKPTIPRACYANSYRLATRRGSRWIYCEGFAVHDRMPLAVPHAWVTPIGNPGEAHDRTWADARGALYIGIAFQTAYIRKVWRAPASRKMDSFCVLDCWWLHWPLLTGEHKIEDVIWKPE